VSALLLFSFSILIFLVISALGYGQMRKDFNRRYEELQDRFNFMEDGYTRVSLELDRERSRVKDLAKQLEESRLSIQERDTLLRDILPTNPSSLDILLSKGLVSKREAEAKPVSGKDPLEVLVDKGRVTEDQAYEARQLSERIAALHKAYSISSS